MGCGQRMPSGFVDRAAEWIVVPLTEMEKTKGGTSFMEKSRSRGFFFSFPLNVTCFITKIRTEGVCGNSSLYLPIS